MVIKIAGISGSLRAGSYNTLLLEAAQKLAPEGVVIEILDYSTFPLFNQDLEGDVPEAVNIFKQKVAESDAVLFVTPEYNGSIPGPLKNAIDWGSRPYGKACWTNKPVGIMGATPGKYLGTSGTARAQLHLRQIVALFDMPPVQQPEVIMPAAGDQFNDKGELVSDFFKQRVAEHMKQLVKLAKMSKAFNEG